jgi:hypothetical protein
MGYKLDAKQRAFILESFYSGMPLRSVACHFRNTFGLPISPSTIFREVVNSAGWVDQALACFNKQEKWFRLKVGRIWEMDEIYVEIEATYFPLILVKDLRTGFIVGKNLALSVTSEAVKEALVNAKVVTRMCPIELRGDGHPAYSRAVRVAFKGKTKLSVNKRIGKMGMDQSIEGTNGVLRSRIKRMRSLHSKDASPHIINGLIADYNFARPSEALGGRIPAELAYGWRTLDDKSGWLVLLSLAESYKRMVLREAKQKFPKLTENRVSQTLDRFLRPLPGSRVEAT